MQLTSQNEIMCLQSIFIFCESMADIPYQNIITDIIITPHPLFHMTWHSYQTVIYTMYVTYRSRIEYRIQSQSKCTYTRLIMWHMMFYTKESRCVILICHTDIKSHSINISRCLLYMQIQFHFEEHTMFHEHLNSSCDTP